MTSAEAWIVTALGMSVVFSGLLLCVVVIRLLGRLGRHVSWGENGHAHGVSAAPSTPAVAEVAPPETPAEPLPADLLAVIATVLQIERQLYLNQPGARLTIRRPVGP